MNDTEIGIRPRRLQEFIGQKVLRENLRVFINGALERREALDHILFHGPPGLGKTTLAQIVAQELGVGFRSTTGPVLVKAGDLAAILTNLEPLNVLFIDEIHRLNPAVEEILYSAMEDRKLDLIIGEGPAARSLQIDLEHFTLIGATTRSGLLTTPLRDRFLIPLRLDFYAVDELVKIVHRGGKVINTEVTPDGAAEIATRSRGTPRVAVRLLRRVSVTLPVQRPSIHRLPTRPSAGWASMRSASIPWIAAISRSWPTTTVAALSAVTRSRRFCQRRGTRLKR